MQGSRVGLIGGASVSYVRGLLGIGETFLEGFHWGGL